jgi:sodium/proline symporter
VLAGTLVVYLVVLLALGVWAQRRTKDEGDFFVGGRRTGGLVAAIGAAASSSSAWTLLGVSGAAYSWGLGALWIFPACVGGFLLNWTVFAPALRRFGHRTGAMTLVEAVSGGRRVVSAVAAAIVLVSLGAYVAAQLQGAGKTFEAVFEVPATQTIAVGSLVIVAYTLLGGFLAVSLTDTVQGLVMAVSALALPVAALVSVGGPSGLLDDLARVEAEGYLALGGPRPWPVAIGFAAGLLGIGLGYPGQPHVAKYFLALSDDRGVVRRARVIAIGWAVTVYGGMILLGLCGRALFPTLEDGEVVLVVAAERLFPPAVAGVMLAAVLSAMMSTADSQLLVGASTLVHDLGVGGERLAKVTVTRVTVALLTAVAAAAASLGSETIFERVLFGWAAMGASLGPLLLVRVVAKRRIGPGGSLAVLLCGALLAAAAHLFYEDVFGTKSLRGLAIHVLPYVVTTAIAFGVSRPADPEA